MADPLSQLRQFYVNNREIKKHNGYIIFGDHGWPKDVNTNYRVYSTDDDRSRREYYTLECLHYFLENMHVAHGHYIRQGSNNNIPVVRRPDRKNLLSYLRGEIQTTPEIDRNAPIPATLRLPVSEIYKLSGASYDPQPGTSSQSSAHNDASKAGDQIEKRTHDDSEIEKARKEFASKLNEPSTKRLAAMPTENLDTSVDNFDSAVVQAFGKEKLAKLKDMRMAVKRTTVIDLDMDLGKGGSAVPDATKSKETDLLIAIDSDPSKLIKSKEKVWRNRTTILQAPSKDFVKTVLPLIDTLNRPTERKSHGMPPPVPIDPLANPYQSQSQPQVQPIPKSTYNRYDQERFAKLDIEIDTKKSYVMESASNTFSASQAANPGALPRIPPSVPTQPLGPQRPTDQLDSRHRHAAPNNHPNNSNNHPSNNSHHHKNNLTAAAHHQQLVNSGQKHKRRHPNPIIIIPATPTSLINLSNAQAILQDLTYDDGSSKPRPGSEVLIMRRKPDGTTSQYKIIDNPIKLDSDDWNRVVAVFVQGPAWQFKGWPWGGSPVEIFSKIKAFHLKWDESKLDDNVAKWNVHILELSRTKRHLDKASLLKFWSTLDSYMVRYKSFLRF